MIQRIKNLSIEEKWLLIFLTVCTVLATALYLWFTDDSSTRVSYFERARIWAEADKQIPHVHAPMPTREQRRAQRLEANLSMLQDLDYVHWTQTADWREVAWQMRWKGAVDPSKMPHRLRMAEAVK